ncbi:Crinkler (CRN) [Phytophthora megakarya]|uniref:Crinkler (CRN) n=1 Tax=Phytophthora megakarya TaxID=4795 RepID=A0A225UXV0_9STRA|nr:Crinkler (CRN) [Phytophthora megakarya]
MDSMPLNEPSFQLLLSTVDDIIETSAMQNVETASDEDKMTLIDAVMRAVCRECTSRVKIERNVSFKCKALQAFGRVDLLRDGEMEKAIVIQCNENEFDKAMAQMAVILETALLERVAREPEMNEHIYGIVSDFLTWKVMELGPEEARFCTLKNENKKEDGLRLAVGALAALLQGKEAREI